MERRSPRLSLEELSLLRWFLGGTLMLLSVVTVFYMDVGADLMAAVAMAGIIYALVRPASPARVPILVHRLAFPAIVAFFIGDLWATGQLLPAIVRLDLLLLLYRGISHRARRDDLQIVVLGLFLIVVSGVLTVSLLFAAQILVFTACALALLMVVTITAAAEGGSAPALAVRGVVPPWAAHASWRALFRRLREIADWRLLAAGSALFVGVVAVSALLFMAIPRFQLENSLFLERFVVRRAMTGFNDQIKFGDITDITTDDSVAFNVDLSDPAQAPADPYWRMVVLDEYRNGGFKLSAKLRSVYELNRERLLANLYSQAYVPDGAPTWTFYFEAGVSRYLPLLGGFRALRFREAQNFHFSQDLCMLGLSGEPAAMTAYRVEGMAPGDRLPDRTFARRWAARANIGARTVETGLDGINASDRASLARDAAGIGSAAALGTGGFAAKAIASLRAAHNYSLSPHIPAGPGDPLVRWVNSREAGHCELFAGALVLLARSAGIPARVVTGFRGGTWNAFSGNYTIRNSDAHAWAELWDERAGVWLREDPLGAPQGSEQAGNAAIAALMDRSWSARFSSLRVFWYRRIVNFDQQDQAATLKAVKTATDSSGRWMRESLAAALARLRSWASAPWSGARLARLAAAVAGAWALVWAIMAARWRLPSLRGGRGQDPVRREAGRWLRRVREPEALVADLQRLRFGPAPSWPRPSEVFRRARRASSSRRRPPSSQSTS
jgi:hypothetical protein